MPNTTVIQTDPNMQHVTRSSATSTGCFEMSVPEPYPFNPGSLDHQAAERPNTILYSSYSAHASLPLSPPLHSISAHSQGKGHKETKNDGMN